MLCVCVGVCLHLYILLCSFNPDSLCDTAVPVVPTGLCVPLCPPPLTHITHHTTHLLPLIRTTLWLPLFWKVSVV